MLGSRFHKKGVAHKRPHMRAPRAAAPEGPRRWWRRRARCAPGCHRRRAVRLEGRVRAPAHRVGGHAAATTRRAPRGSALSRRCHAVRRALRSPLRRTPALHARTTSGATGCGGGGAPSAAAAAAASPACSAASGASDSVTVACTLVCHRSSGPDSSSLKEKQQAPMGAPQRATAPPQSGRKGQGCRPLARRSAPFASRPGRGRCVDGAAARRRRGRAVQQVRERLAHAAGRWAVHAPERRTHAVGARAPLGREWRQEPGRPTWASAGQTAPRVP